MCLESETGGGRVLDSVSESDIASEVPIPAIETQAGRQGVFGLRIGRDRIPTNTPDGRTPLSNGVIRRA